MPVRVTVTAAIDLPSSLTLKVGELNCRVPGMSLSTMFKVAVLCLPKVKRLVSVGLLKYQSYQFRRAIRLIEIE
jgi:hypothetical protein